VLTIGEIEHRPNRSCWAASIRELSKTVTPIFSNHQPQKLILGIGIGQTQQVHGWSICAPSRDLIDKKPNHWPVKATTTPPLYQDNSPTRLQDPTLYPAPNLLYPFIMVSTVPLDGCT